MLRVAPQDRAGDELEVGDETGGQVQCADLRPVAELQHRRDQIDDDRGIHLVDVVLVHVGEITDEEAEVQRHREDDEETEHHFLEIHSDLLRPVGDPRIVTLTRMGANPVDLTRVASTVSGPIRMTWTGLASGLDEAQRLTRRRHPATIRLAAGKRRCRAS